MMRYRRLLPGLAVLLFAAAAFFLFGAHVAASEDNGSTWDNPTSEEALLVAAGLFLLGVTALWAWRKS